MLNQLPPPDLNVKYHNEQIDALFGQPVEVFVSGAVRGSDIKWNDFAGTIRILTLEAKPLQIGSCRLVRFTGNCGAKSISHVYIPIGMSYYNKKWADKVLALFESFAYHKTNCGLLVGSDTDSKLYKGMSLLAIRDFGKNYHHEKPLWNPNYKHSKEHTISLFWKDLTSEENIPDYWMNEEPCKSPSVPTPNSF
jgi:hypothetical protein